MQRGSKIRRTSSKARKMKQAYDKAKEKGTPAKAAKRFAQWGKAAKRSRKALRIGEFYPTKHGHNKLKLKY